MAYRTNTANRIKAGISHRNLRARSLHAPPKHIYSTRMMAPGRLAVFCLLIKASSPHRRDRMYRAES